MNNTVRACAAIFAAFALLNCVAVQAGDLQQISVPAGDLATALDLLAKQTGTELVYRSEVVRGLTTPGVTGSMEAADAVARLLVNTKLEVREDETGALLVTQAPASDAKEASDPKDPTDAPTGALSQVKTFNIKSQTLASALKTFAEQSGVVVALSEALGWGKTNSSVRGDMPPSEALRKLLVRSGLTFVVSADGAVTITDKVVGSVQVGNGKSDLNGNLKMPATLGGDLTGRVLDQESGSPLAGAVVRIEELDQGTHTDPLGYFRFARLPAGEYTVSVSYLGFADKLWRAAPEAKGTAPTDYRLARSQQNLEEVTIFGTRSARGKALNEQRTAENSSFVLSTDTLGNFTGTTVSEALRRAPGVAFQRDRITGDGQNVILRGLAPEMNAIKLNGLDLPVNNGTGRAPAIDNMLADSVENIVIHHTLLPSMDSAGSGGLVEIETKSPLQRKHRFVSFGIQGGRSVHGDFSHDALATGTVSGTFGAEERIGLSASVQYRRRTVRNYNYSTTLATGQYMPLERDGTLNILSASDVDPRIPFPFEPGADQAYQTDLSTARTDSNDSTLDATITGEWRVGEHSRFRLDAQRARSRSLLFARTSEINFASSYQPREVASLGGETRMALGWDGFADLLTNYQMDDSESTTDTVSFRGESNFGSWEHRYTLGYAKGSARTPLSRSFVSSYKTNTNGALDESLIRPEATDHVEGRIISVFGQRVGDGLQLPLLTDAGWAFFNNPANQYFSGGSIGNLRGQNTRYTGQLASRYDLKWRHFKYVEVGVNFESAKFSNNATTLAISTQGCDPSVCVDGYSIPLAAFGLVPQSAGLEAIGLRQPGLNVLSRDGVKSFFRRLPEFEAQGLVSLFPQDEDPRLRQVATVEKNLAAWLQAQMNFGKLEIVGGARLSHVRTNASNLYSPTFVDENGITDVDFINRFSRLVDEAGTVSDLLPRVQLNYRLTPDLIFRGSYNLAVARPALSLLSSEDILRLDLSGEDFQVPGRPVLRVDKGNPALKPAVTNSFDLGLEYYSKQIGLMSFNAFYKRIEHLLEYNTVDNVNIALADIQVPDDPRFHNLSSIDDLFVSIRTPVNGSAPAHVWGMEGHLERQFTFLPGVWSGLGIFTNLTYTQSSKQQQYSWYGPQLDSEGKPVYVDGFLQRQLYNIKIGSVPFNEQPKYSGTFALTYNKYDIDATLTYSAQSRRQANFAANGLGPYYGPDESLDLHIAKRFKLRSGQYNVYLEGTDLLRGATDPDLLDFYHAGSSTYTTGATYLGGRQFKLGVTASY